MLKSKREERCITKVKAKREKKGECVCVCFS